MRLILEFALWLRRLYWWFIRPETVGVRAVVLDIQNNILLVKHKYGTGWFLPGGKVKKGETPEKGLERELREELGIVSLVIERVLGTYTSLQEYKRDTITVYVVRQFTRVESFHFEIEKVGFFATDNLPEGTSPGTKRRVREYLNQQPIATMW